MDNELISVVYGVSAEEKKKIEELIRIRQARKLRALETVITGITPLKDEDDNKIVRKRTGRGTGKVDYIPGWWFVEQMNALFGHYWDSEVKEYKVDWEKKMVYSLVRVEVVKPGYTVTERSPDGRVTETRFDEVRIGHTQFGSSDIKTYSNDIPITKKGTGEILGYSKKRGDIIDIADDLKSSATDGMKKACSWFGLGADIYGRREDNEQSEEDKTKSQYSVLYKTGKDKGMDKEKVDAWVLKKTGQSTDNLPEHKILGLISDLRTSP